MMLGMSSTNSAIVQTVHEMKRIWTKVISEAAAADNMSTGIDFMSQYFVQNILMFCNKQVHND